MRYRLVQDAHISTWLPLPHLRHELIGRETSIFPTPCVTVWCEQRTWQTNYVPFAPWYDLDFTRCSRVPYHEAVRPTPNLLHAQSNLPASLSAHRPHQTHSADVVPQ